MCEKIKLACDASWTTGSCENQIKSLNIRPGSCCKIEILMWSNFRWLRLWKGNGNTHGSHSVNRKWLLQLLPMEPAEWLILKHFLAQRLFVQTLNGNVFGWKLEVNVGKSNAILMWYHSIQDNVSNVTRQILSDRTSSSKSYLLTKCLHLYLIIVCTYFTKNRIKKIIIKTGCRVLSTSSRSSAQR